MTIIRFELWLSWAVLATNLQIILVNLLGVENASRDFHRHARCAALCFDIFRLFNILNAYWIYSEGLFFAPKNVENRAKKGPCKQTGL